MEPRTEGGVCSGHLIEELILSGRTPGAVARANALQGTFSKNCYMVKEIGALRRLRPDLDYEKRLASVTDVYF